MEARGGFGLAMMTKMGPNDVRHVIWAIGMYSFLFCAFFLVINMYLSYMDAVKAQGGFGWAMTENGPNDVSRHVIWALGMFFF